MWLGLTGASVFHDLGSAIFAMAASLMIISPREPISSMNARLLAST